MNLKVVFVVRSLFDYFAAQCAFVLQQGWKPTKIRFKGVSTIHKIAPFGCEYISSSLILSGVQNKSKTDMYNHADKGAKIHKAESIPRPRQGAMWHHQTLTSFCMAVMAYT
jgi:hypothetical protein